MQKRPQGWGHASLSMFTPLTDMMNAAQAAPFGDDSLFKNPVGAEFDVLNTLKPILPGFDPSSAIGDINEGLSDHASSLSSNMSVMLAAKNMQTQVASVDAAASGVMTDSTKDELVDSTFQGTKPCPGVNIKAAFAPLTEVAKAVNDAFTPVVTAIKSALGAVGNAIQGIKDITASIITQLQAKGAIVLGAIATAATTAMNAAKATFNELMVGAKEAIDGAVAYLKSFALMNLMNSKDQCIQTVMASVVNPAAVKPEALNALDNAGSTAVPAKDAIAKASALQMENVYDDPVARDVMVDRDSIPNLYTLEELSAFRDTLRAKNAEVEDLKKEAAKKLIPVEEWKAANKVSQLKAIVGATKENPYGVQGTPEEKATWKSLQEQYQPMQAEYNDFVQNTVNPEEARYKAMYSEYGARARYGKTPYTTAKQFGRTFTDAQQTVLLDSGI